MVQLIVADKKYKELYRNLFNMYQNELSQYFTSYQWVDNEGYFDKDTVEIYFQNNPLIYPLVIKWNGKNVGVMVVTKGSFPKGKCDYCIQDFFIIQSCRGKGVAEKACKLVFDKLKGNYSLRVLKRNHRAIAYWDKILSQCATKVQADVNEEDLIYKFII